MIKEKATASGIAQTSESGRIFVRVCVRLPSWLAWVTAMSGGSDPLARHDCGDGGGR